MSVTANSQEMNFNTKDLIEKLEANRLKHIEEYNEAVIGYKEKIGEALKEAAKKFKADNTIYDDGFKLSLQTPVSYEKEYNTILEMLKFCTDETIRLDRSSFQNFVMDEWHWKSHFSTINSSYTISKQK